MSYLMNHEMINTNMNTKPNKKKTKYKQKKLVITNGKICHVVSVFVRLPNTAKLNV